MSKINNSCMKDRRGVSPLVATVLLVALVIIIAILIWLWYGKFIEDIQNKQQLDLEMACVQDVEFVLSDLQVQVPLVHSSLSEPSQASPILP